MIPKSKRLISKEVDLLMKTGKSLNFTVFFVRFLVNKNLKTTKFAFLTPKKIFKKAFERNQARRLGYLALEKSISLFPLGLIIAFSFKTKEQNFSLIERELNYISKYFS